MKLVSEYECQLLITCFTDHQLLPLVTHNCNVEYCTNLKQSCFLELPLCF